jgi:TRAP-type C4-dicarboxylate transport system permease small subunit
MQNASSGNKFMSAVTLASDFGLYVSIAAVFILSVIVFINVAVRHLSIPISLLFAEEYSAYLVIAITFLSAAYALRQGAHIKVTLLTDMLPERIKKWWDVFAASICLLIVVLLLYYGTKFFLAALFSGQRSDTIMATPLWIPRLLLVPGYLLLALEMMVYIMKKIRG